MTLTFIESTARYSTYRDRDGGTVHLAPGGLRRMIRTDEIAGLWETFVDDGQMDAVGDHLYFSEWFESIEGWLLDEHVQASVCADCDVVVITNARSMLDITAQTVGRDDDPVCGTCFQSYSLCEHCDGAFDSDDMLGTVSDGLVCESCAGGSYNYCNHCEARYHCESDHDHECHCESPAMTFTVPAGGGRLHEDESYTVTLPVGTISEEGLHIIARLIWAEVGRIDLDGVGAAATRQKLRDLAGRVGDVGHEWQTRQGNYTKRLSRFAYKDYGYKIPEGLLAKIGTTAREHSSEVTELEVEVTRDLNMDPEQFGNEGSCWWGEYVDSRCALKSHGGFGLRSFDDQSRWGINVNGRAWVMPLKRRGNGLTPTFDTVNPVAYVVFNGYDELEGYAGARVLAHMVGMSYRKIKFRCSPMYVNSNAGYLVSTEEILSDPEFAEVHLSLNTHTNLYYDEAATLVVADLSDVSTTISTTASNMEAVNA